MLEVRMFRVLGWGALVCCLFGWTAGESLAFERQKTETGVPIAWKQMPVRFVVDNRGMGDYFTNNPGRGGMGSEIAAVQLAFQAWSQAQCPNGKVALSFRDQGVIQGKQVGYDRMCSDCNTNLIIFRYAQGSWQYDQQLLVQTTVNFEQNTGEIFDADIEVNAEFHEFSTNPQTENDVRLDLLSVLMYGVGKFVGLDDNPDPMFRDATMGSQLEGTNKRTLEQDDIEGICNAYPPATSGPTPPTYQQVEEFRALGCAQLPEGDVWWGLWGLGLLLILRVRRRV